VKYVARTRKAAAITRIMKLKKMVLFRKVGRTVGISKGTRTRPMVGRVFGSFASGLGGATHAMVRADEPERVVRKGGGLCDAATRTHAD
jgi:hypothetical protein